MTSSETKPKLTHKSPEYIAFKPEFEKTHYFMEQPPRFVRIKNGEPYYYAYTDFYRDIHNECPLVKLWVKDPKKRTYTKTVFVPYTKKNTTPVDCINTFKGFRFNTPVNELKARQSTEEDVKWFHDYLTELSGGNMEVKQLIYNLIADIIQNPHQSPEICLVLMGQMGVGKDTLVQIISALIGFQYKYSTANFDEIFGTFNSQIDGKIVLGIEEVSVFDSKRYEDRLKSFITCPEITINQKNVPKFTTKNMTRIIMTSNSDYPVQIPIGNRRYIVIRVPSTRKGDTAYWKTLYGILEHNETYLNAVFHELLHYDLPKDWNKSQNLPETEVQQRMEHDSVFPLWAMLDEYFNPENVNHDDETRDSVEKWIEWCFHDVPEGCCYITSKNFEKMFLDYTDREGGFHNFSRKGHIDNKLRDCDAIQTVVRRIDGKKTQLKLINEKKLIEYIARENLLGKKPHRLIIPPITP